MHQVVAAEIKSQRGKIIQMPKEEEEQGVGYRRETLFMLVAVGVLLCLYFW